MTLVEKAVLDRLRQKQITQSFQQPQLTNLVQIQTHIEDLLGNTKLSDDAKVALLQRAQNRFSQFKAAMTPHSTAAPEADKEPEIVPPAAKPAAVPAALLAAAPGDAAAAAAEPAATPAPAPTADMFQTVAVPTKMKNKFSSLKSFFTQHPGLIGKNSKNEMVISGKPIQGSNFDDLMRNLYVKKQDYNLLGNMEFMNALRTSNLSTSLLSNTDLVSQYWPRGSPTVSAPTVPTPHRATKRSKTGEPKPYTWSFSDIMPKSFSGRKSISAKTPHTPRPPFNVLAKHR